MKIEQSFHNFEIDAMKRSLIGLAVFAVLDLLGASWVIFGLAVMLSVLCIAVALLNKYAEPFRHYSATLVPKRIGIEHEVVSTIDRIPYWFTMGTSLIATFIIASYYPTLAGLYLSAVVIVRLSMGDTKSERLAMLPEEDPTFEQYLKSRKQSDYKMCDWLESIGAEKSRIDSKRIKLAKEHQTEEYVNKMTKAFNRY